MKKETLFAYFYTKAEKAIRKIGKQTSKDIYAISFWKDNIEDDPRCPIITIGYNTLTQVEAEQKNASSLMEAKWNYAFWLQNELEDKLDEQDKQMQSVFMDIIVSVVKELHQRGVVKEQIGIDVPIIVHELEYYDLPIDWTIRSNPKPLIDEFLEFYHDRSL